MALGKSLINRRIRLERFVEASTFRRYLRARAASKRAPEYAIDGKAYRGDSSSAAARLIRPKNQLWDPYLGSLAGDSLNVRYRRIIIEDPELQALFLMLEADPDSDSAFSGWLRRAERRPHITLAEAREEGRRIMRLIEEMQGELQEDEPILEYKNDDPYELE